MNKNFKFGDCYAPLLTKLFRIMRLMILMLVLGINSLSAVTSYSQSTKITLKTSDTRVEDVLNQIEEKSEFYFLFNQKLIDLNRKVSLDVKEEKISAILDNLFAGTDVKYQVIDRQIVLTTGIASQTQQANTKKVSGKVTDQSGTSLPGVSVVVKGTTNGVITGMDGTYSISNIAENATLQFSFVGMKTQEVPVAGKSTFNISLEEETIGLGEVVAIGYGTVKKSDLTGAVASVKGQAIADRQTTQLSQALQGATSGVMVTRNNNAPGSTASIRIRGITTIGDSNPLVIVDGVPVDNINDINPNDVQDMSVLKDAASASIYGSRAASGVILITTKRAKTGEVALTYNVEYGFEKPTGLPEYVDAQRYMQMANELRWNDNNNNTNEYPIYTKDIIDNYAKYNTENPNKYPITDWVNLVLNSSAPRQSHVVSITAGTKSVRTKASLAYDKTDALYDGRTYERITARFNNDITINKYLSASVDFSFKRSISKQPSIDPIYVTFISAPVYAAEWADGRVAEGKTGANIYGQLKYGGNNNSWYNQIGGKVSLDFTPFDGFKISAVLSPNMGFDKGKNFQKRVPYYSADDPTVYAGTLQWGSATNLYETRNDYSRITSQLIANYTKSFGNHNINLMAGAENYKSFNENLGASREKYELTSFPYLDLGPLELRGNSGSAYENAYRSYFGRAMYNYQNKYFLQGNIRYDGSSRFHENYRWGSFPSFSAGWVMSEESFIKSIPTISFLKLRGSWGYSGK